MPQLPSPLSGAVGVVTRRAPVWILRSEVVMFTFGSGVAVNRQSPAGTFTEGLLAVGEGFMGYTVEVVTLVLSPASYISMTSVRPANCGPTLAR